MSHVIELNKLSFAYGQAPILNQCTTSFTTGQLNGLFGPNGAGKTTLLNLMLGTLKPGSGQVLVDGVDISRMTDKNRARQIAYVPQNTKIQYGFTVEEIVKMGRYPHLGFLKDLRHKDQLIIEKAMAMTGLLNLKDRQVNTLSGGEMQRVIIARALAQDTPIILLDEPISHLDLKYQKEIIYLLKEIQKKEDKLIIVILHDLNVGLSHCDLAYLFEEEDLRVGQPKQVFTKKVIEKVYETQVDFVSIDHVHKIHW